MSFATSAASGCAGAGPYSTSSCARNAGLHRWLDRATGSRRGPMKKRGDSSAPGRLRDDVKPARTPALQASWATLPHPPRLQHSHSASGPAMQMAHRFRIAKDRKSLRDSYSCNFENSFADKRGKAGSTHAFIIIGHQQAIAFCCNFLMIVADNPVQHRQPILQHIDQTCAN